MRSDNIEIIKLLTTIIKTAKKQWKMDNGKLRIRILNHSPLSILN